MANILIVDDDRDGIMPLMICLQRAGHFVTCFPNGRDAMKALLMQVPDLIVLDLVMPEMDGSSFLQVVRSYFRLQRLPVVVLTATDDGRLLDQVRTLQPSAILIKMKNTFKDILRAIEEALGKRA